MQGLTSITHALMPGFGAEIIGADISRTNETERQDILSACQQHGALGLHDRKLTPEQFIAFGDSFDALTGHTFQDFTLPAHPETYTLSNRIENGRPVGAHDDRIGWHTDHAYKVEPVMCNLPYAIKAKLRR
jgi:taurine dioxygenase